MQNTLNLYSVVSQLYLNKSGRGKKRKSVQIFLEVLIPQHISLCSNKHRLVHIQRIWNSFLAQEGECSSLAQLSLAMSPDLLALSHMSLSLKPRKTGVSGLVFITD